MTEFSIQIASSPQDIADLAKALEEKKAGLAATIDRSAPSRDFSILEVLITAITAQSIGLLFSLLKDFIVAKLEEGKTNKSFAIRLDGTVIEIKTMDDLSKLEELAETKKAAAGHDE